MESVKEGVVYFSLGSVVKSSKMPKETVSLLLSELSKIEQTVLWKWEADDIPQLPKNVIVRKWFPQNDILGTYLALIWLFVRRRKSSVKYNETYWFLMLYKCRKYINKNRGRGQFSQKEVIVTFHCFILCKNVVHKYRLK